jgi:hypothetical protein
MYYDEEAMGGNAASSRQFEHQSIALQMALLQQFPIQFP